MISNKKIFEEKIKPILTYVGTIGAILTSVAYIITIVVLIVGFKAQKNLNESIVFSIVSALIGIVIIQFMKIQGIEFAKQLPENQEILKLYNNTQTVDKKPHSIKYYWITSIIKDIVIKGTSMCLTTAAIIYIVIEGSQDWNMFLLAIVNLVMFICFGMLTLTSSYDFYNDRHIPYINSLIKKGETETNVQD